MSDAVAVLAGWLIGLVSGVLLGLMLARYAMEREARRLLDYMEASRDLPVQHKTRTTGATYIAPAPREDN